MFKFVGCFLILWQQSCCGSVNKIKHSIRGFRHVLLLQAIYYLIPHISCYPSCCNSFCDWGLNVLVHSSGNFCASATSLHLGWHAHPGNGSAGNSNHTTTRPETCADRLKIVLGLTESMGEASRCAAHKAPASQVPVPTQSQQMCCSHSTNKPSPCGVQAAGLCGGVLVRDSWGSSTVLWCKQHMSRPVCKTCNP